MSAEIDVDDLEESELTVVVSPDYLADLTQDPTTPFECPAEPETAPFERPEGSEVSACYVGDGVWLSSRYMQRITDALRAERERRLGRSFP